MIGTGSLYVWLVYGAGISEVIVNLAIEFLPVGDDHESPVAPHLAKNLPGEKYHRVALAASLRMPEHPEPTFDVFNVLESVDSIVHSEELVVLGDHLNQCPTNICKQDEILHQVEKPRFLACATDHSIQ